MLLTQAHPKYLPSNGQKNQCFGCHSYRDVRQASGNSMELSAKAEK